MHFGNSKFLSTAGSPASVRRFATVSKIMPVIGSPCLGAVGFLFSSEIPPIMKSVMPTIIPYKFTLGD